MYISFTETQPHSSHISACIKPACPLSWVLFFFFVSLYFFPNDTFHGTLDFLILSEDQTSLLFLQSCLYATWLAFTAERSNIA